MGIPKFISEVGIYSAIIGSLILLVITLYCQSILIQARNRFKKDRIVDIGDLGAKLYGEGVRHWLSLLLVVSNIQYLIVYELFFAKEIDDLVCETYELAPCGYGKVYVAMINILLLPIIF